MSININYLNRQPLIYINKNKLKLQIALRKLTSKNRVLPSVIINGAMKSGTTSLFYYLSQHPELFPSFTKEVHFFDGGIYENLDTFKKGESWYRAHFPLKKELPQNAKTFEATPLYLPNPLSAFRINELLPDVKLISVLRNPTERAISHYFHERRYNREPLGLLEALQEEEKRLSEAIKNNLYKSKEFIHYSYKYRGLYYQQIKRIYQYFPKNQVLILCSENLLSDPVKELRKVLNFIGVDYSKNISNLKAQHISENKETVSTDVLHYLNEYFKSHNENLFKLIGEKFNW